MLRLRTPDGSTWWLGRVAVVQLTPGGALRFYWLSR